MEMIVNGEKLINVLSLLAPGMVLTVPDEWLDRTISGTRAQRATLVDKMALDYGCSCRPGMGVQIFEKQELHATG
jgi:hypothetical protein